MKDRVDMKRCSYLEGPSRPAIVYLLVFERMMPPTKTLITVDGVYKYAKKHKEDKERGFDWGPYEIFAISFEGDQPEIARVSLVELLDEMNAKIHTQVEANRKAMGL